MTEPWNFTEAKRKSIDELLHDPRPESEAEREEERERRAVAEHECPRCHIPALNRCRAEDLTLLDRPHPERVKLVKES